MNQRFRCPPLMGILVVALGLGLCMPALAAPASPASQGCATGTGHELSSSKTSPPTLWAMPGAMSAGSDILLCDLSPTGSSFVDLTPDLFSTPLWGDLSSRAPPTAS